MRHLTDDGLALIKRVEGFAPEVYVCPGGWPTIGYGHVVRDAERDRFADGIDEATAEELLRRDVETAERAVLRLIQYRSRTDNSTRSARLPSTSAPAPCRARRSGARSTAGSTTRCRPSSGAGCGPVDGSSLV